MKSIRELRRWDRRGDASHRGGKPFPESHKFYFRADVKVKTAAIQSATETIPGCGGPPFHHFPCVTVRPSAAFQPMLGCVARQTVVAFR